MLDFSKAFDTLNHKLLCAKLNYYGFDDNAVSLFKSYLSNRRQRVVINNDISNDGVISSGVPQGSILGPLLFLIYTADIFSVISHSRSRAFADDLQIYYHFDIKMLKAACDSINKDLTKIENYCHENNLKINSSKCSVICFSNTKSKEFLKHNTKIKIGGNTLAVTSSVKNLGLIIDDDFRFKSHVNSVVKKSYFALKILYSNHHILNFKQKKNCVKHMY